MISAKTENLYTVHKSDKYKNSDLSDDPKYRDVKPLGTYMKHKGKYAVAIFDPPYSSQAGGHTATNCNLKRSASKMKFNDQYGTTFQYSATLILSMIAETCVLATKLLAPGGFFLVKCKDYKGLPYTSEVTRLAREKKDFSYWGTYVFSTRDKVVRNPSDYSNMLVFRKTPTSATETQCASLEGEEMIAHATVEYQNIATEAKKRESTIKESFAELLVHYAELCGSYENFVERVSTSYSFSTNELGRFLKLHNMETKDQFKRNKNNGQVLRQARTNTHESTKQTKLD